MPLGIISDEDFAKEYSNSVPKGPTITVPTVEGTVIRAPELGRGVGNKEVPESLRKIIGETNELESRSDALELASTFGISASSTSAYANGSTSTASYDKTKPSITEHINSQKSRVAKRAQSKLLTALSHITEEKMQYAKISDLAFVAKSMSAIVKDMEPDVPNIANVNAPQFVIYAPRMSSEDKYEVIQVNE